MVTQVGTIEREVKLGVWPGFQLPELRGVFDGIASGRPEEWRLEAVYFDTADLRLLRRGVTVRFRRGEDPPEVWTATLPEEGAPLGLAGREVSVVAGPTSVPMMLEDLVRGWGLGAPLVPVARLRTLRQRTTLRRPNGTTVAVVDDDEVSILQRSRVAARFRELELELTNGAPNKLLTRLTKHMCAAGAQPVDQMPKLVRALGPSALAPWDLAARKLDTRSTAGEAITAALTASAARLIDHIAAVVLDENPEGVHQSRVAIRTLRSDLRTAKPLLAPERVKPLRRELDWLMDSLGEVRDLDVLMSQLRADASALDPTDAAGAAVVLTTAAADRASAYERLRADLRSPRCGALLEETARVATNPPLKPRRARRPPDEVLPGLLRRPLRDLRREWRDQRGEPGDEELHRLRMVVKRLRYATELVAPVGGKKARRAARRLARIQTALGEHNDSCVAEAKLRALGERTGDPGSWAAGLFGGLALARAAESRARFPAVWARATAGKRWRWIK